MCKTLCFYSISLWFAPNDPIYNKKHLIPKMQWRQTGDEPLYEPMVAWFTDVCIYASRSLVQIISFTSKPGNILPKQFVFHLPDLFQIAESIVDQYFVTSNNLCSHNLTAQHHLRNTVLNSYSKAKKTFRGKGLARYVFSQMRPLSDIVNSKVDFILHDCWKIMYGHITWFMRKLCRWLRFQYLNWHVSYCKSNIE